MPDTAPRTANATPTAGALPDRRRLVWGVDLGFLVVLSALPLVAMVAGTPGRETGVIGEVTRRLRRQTLRAEDMFCLPVIPGHERASKELLTAFVELFPRDDLNVGHGRLASPAYT